MLWSWTQCDYRPPSGHTGFKITSASTAGSPATKNLTAQPANPAYKGNRSKDNINRIPALVNPLEHPISILSVQPGAKEKGDYDRRSLRSAAPFFRSEDRLFHWITHHSILSSQDTTSLQSSLDTTTSLYSTPVYPQLPARNEWALMALEK